MKKIILASASPRRRELLEQVGLRFEVEPSDVPEEDDGRPPGRLAVELASRKAASIAARHAGEDAVVLGADTIVVVDGVILGKPRDDADARRMLRSLSGREHSVITGFALHDVAADRRISGSVETRVRFRELADPEIDVYVASGEPRDKAGAYAIQGLGALLVERVEGSYSNVIGLPLTPVALALRQLGVSVLGLP